MGDDSCDDACCGYLIAKLGIDNCIGAACCVGSLIVIGSVCQGHSQENYVELQQKNIPARIVEHYQKNIGPQLKKELGKEKICKFEPSCSEYARQAIEKHGPTKGSVMAAYRLARCNPLSKGGYDPVK